jgi:hypothetical protein
MVQNIKICCFIKRIKAHLQNNSELVSPSYLPTYIDHSVDKCKAKILTMTHLIKKQEKQIVT